MITDQIQLEVEVEQIESEQISMSATAMVYMASPPVQQLRYYQAQMELPTHQLTLPITQYYNYNKPLGWDPGAL